MAVIPVRLLVLKRLAALLEGTAGTVSGVVVPNLTGRINRGISVLSGDKDQWPLPRLSILENVQPGLFNSAGENDFMRSETWNLLLQGWVDDDVKNPTDPAYELAALVENRLSRIIATKKESGLPKFGSDYMLGLRYNDGKPLISDFSFGPSVVRPPQENVSTRAFFYCFVRISFPSKLGEALIALDPGIVPPGTLYLGNDGPLVLDGSSYLVLEGME